MTWRHIENTGKVKTHKVCNAYKNRYQQEYHVNYTDSNSEVWKLIKASNTFPEDLE